MKKPFLIFGLVVVAGALTAYLLQKSIDAKSTSRAVDSVSNVAGSSAEKSSTPSSVGERSSDSEPSGSVANQRETVSSGNDATQTSQWYAGIPRELASQQWLEVNGFDTQMQRDSVKLMITDSEGHSALADSGNIYALSQRATGILLQDRDAAASDYWDAALLGSVEAIEKLGVMNVNSDLLEVGGDLGSTKRQAILKGAAYLVVASNLTDGAAGAGPLAQAIAEHQIIGSEFVSICQQALEIEAGLERDRERKGWATHGMHKPPAQMPSVTSPVSCE